MRSAQCGEAVFYHYRDGLPRISGNGPMRGLAAEEPPPWVQPRCYRTPWYYLKVLSVIVCSGVTRIGAGGSAEAGTRRLMFLGHPLERLPESELERIRKR